MKSTTAVMPSRFFLGVQKRSRHLFFTILFFYTGTSRAQIAWTNTGAATQWYTATNWTPATTAGAWLPNSIAQFNNTGTAVTAGIDMSLGSLSIGAIQLTGSRTRKLTIGNASTVAGNLRLNGTTVGGMANVILNRPGSIPDYDFILQDNETGKGKTMNIVLANTTNNIIHISGTGGRIVINSVISGNAKKLTLEGSGSGGKLTLNAANKYTGLTNVSIRAGFLVLRHSPGNTLQPNNDVNIEDGCLQVMTNQTLKNIELGPLGRVEIADGVTLTVTGNFLHRGGGVTITGTGKLVYAPGATLTYVNTGIITTSKEFPDINGPTNLVIQASTAGISSLVSLHAPRIVAGVLKISRSVFLLNGNDFNAASVSASGSFTAFGHAPISSHVVTNSTGKLTINNIGAAAVRFPVGGDIYTYNPLSISSGQGLHYAVRVANNILPAIVHPLIAVNRTWHITPSGTPVLSVNCAFQYTSADGNASFSFISPQELGHYNSSWNIIGSGIPPALTVTVAVPALAGSTDNAFVIGNTGAVL